MLGYDENQHYGVKLWSKYYLKSPNMKMTPEWKARIESTEHNEQENTSQYCNVSQMNLAIVGNLWFMVQFSA